ncbi:hypothetical protein [Candidatus Fukatsuia symbiotica]|uniref:hypothetical protein n=1 Tax=Candidatus Fukatsuia symbiotica TaxID=1878942 RepID=UPI0013C46867|nr:hypothetical protein [Candidatus Fukatsuia symbiotica]
MSTETGAAKCTTPFAVEFTGAFRSPYLPYRLSVSISVKYSAGAAEGEKQGRVIPHPEKQSQLPETPHLAARTSPEPSFTDQGTQTDLPTEPHQPVVPPKAHKSPAVSSSMSEKNVIESKPSEASANKEETQSAKPSTDDKSTFTDPVGVVEKKQHRFLRMIWRFFQGILHKNPSKSEPIVSEKSGTEVEEISGGTSTAREVSSKSVQTSGTVPQMHPTNSRKGGTLQTSRQNGLDSEIHYPRSRSRSVSKEKLVVKMPEERKQPQPTALKKNIKTKSVGTSTLSNSKDASTSVDDLVPAKEHKSVGTSTLSNSKDASTSVDDLVPAKEHKSVGTSMLSNSKDASTSVDGLVPAKEHKSVGTSTLSNSKDASTSVDDLVSAKEHKSVGTSTLSNSKDASTSVDDLEPAKEHKSVGTSTLSNSKDASTSVDDLEPAKKHKSVGASMLSNSKDASTSVDDLEPAKEHKSVGASMLSNSKDASTSVDDLEPAKEHKSVGASMLSNSKDASTSVDGLVTAEEKQEIETPKIDEKTLVEMPGEQNGSESSESVLSKGDSVNGAPVLRQDPQDPKQQGAGWMTAGIRPETEEITSVVAKASKASTQTESTVAISGARTFSLDFSELNKLLSAPYSYDPTSELAPKLPIESNDHVSAEDSFLKDKMAEIVASINKQAELFDSINDENKRLELQDLFFDTTRRIATEQQGLRKIAEQYSLESIEAVIKSLAKEIYKDGLSPKSLSHGNTQSKYIETVSKPAIEAANQAPSRESEEVPKIVPETTSMLPLAPEQADIETQSELSSDKLFSESAVILGAEKKTYADGFVTPKRHRGAKNTAASSFAMQQESTLEISSKAREPSVQLQKGKPSELESKDRFGVLESEEFQTRLNPSVSGQAEPSEETLSLQEVVTNGQEKSIASSESGMMQVMLSPEKMREIKEIDVVGNPHIFTAIKQIDPFNGKKPEVYLLKSENDTVPFIIKKSEEGKLSLDFYGENVVTSVIGDNIDELKSRVKELAKHYGIGQLGGFDIYKVNVQAVTGTMSKPALEANQPSSETVQEEKPTILSVGPSPDAARVSDIPLVLPPKTNSASPQSILSQAEKIPTTAPETTSTLSQKSPVFPLWNEPTESEKTSIGERGVEGFETMPIAVPEESDDQLLARMLAPDPDLDRMLANIQMSQMAPKFSSYLKDRITRLERSIFQKEGILSKGYNDLARLNNESLYSQTVQKLQLHSRELKYRSEEQAFQLLDSGSETLRNAIEYLQKNPDKVVPAISPEEKQQAQQFVTDPRRNSYDAIQSIKNFGEAPQEAARDVRLLKYEIKLIEEYKTKLIAEWNELNSLRPEDEISSQIDTMKAESGENASALNHTTEVTQTANTSLSDAKSKELTKLLETVFGQYEEMLLTADQNLADVELETDNPADPKLVIENSNKRGHIQKWHKVKLEVTKKIEELKSDLERVSKGEYPLLPFLASEPDFKPYYQILPDNREFNSEIKKPAKEKTDWNKLYILHDEKINGINELLILIEKNKESLLENKEKIIKLEGETKDSLIIEERHKLKEKNQEVMVLQKEYRDGNESIEKLKRDLLSTDEIALYLDEKIAKYQPVLENQYAKELKLDLLSADEIALYLDEKIAKYQPVLEEKMGTLTAEKQLSTIESIKEIIGSMADYTDHSQTEIYNGIYNNISALQGDKTVKNIQEILCDRLEIKKCKMIQENIGALEDQRANLEIKIIDIQKKRDSLDINISTLDDEELAREAEIKKCRATIEEINNTIKIQNIKLEELRVSKEELEQEIDNAQEKLGNESDQPKSEPVGPWWYPS